MVDKHQDHLQEFDEIYTTEYAGRFDALEDRRFATIRGAAWEGKIGELFENKPKLEINKIAIQLMRLETEYRNNRITCDFMPKTADNDKMADILDGLYRSDELDSNAEEAYDNAFKESAGGGGYGAYILRAEYEDEYDPDNSQQRIRFEQINDADQSVFFSQDGKRQDKSDCTRAWLIKSMSRRSFEDKYKQNPVSWPKDDEYTYDWATPDVVKVAEVYEKVTRLETYEYYESLDGEITRYSENELTDEKRTELDAKGYVLVNKRKIKTDSIIQTIESGGGVLEGPKKIAGKHIPIVVEYGKRWYIENIERFCGHIRNAKDPARVYNSLISQLATISALSPVEKPILDPDQVSDPAIKQMWERDNIDNKPYLLAKKVRDGQGNVANSPIQYTKSPSIPPALGGLMQMVNQDMIDVLGNPDEGEKLRSNISAKAVNLVQDAINGQYAIYMDNAAKARRRGGQIWLSMASDIYVENGRALKTIGKDKKIGSFKIGEAYKTEDGEIKALTIKDSEHVINVDVGPSTKTRRDATVQSLTGLMQMTADPQDTRILGLLAMMNIEGEGISDIRRYSRENLIKLGVIKPTPEELKELQAQQSGPDANEEYLKSSAINEIAKAEKAAADTELAKAKTEQIRVETEIKDTESGLNMINTLENMASAGPESASNGNHEATIHEIAGNNGN